MNYEDMKKLLFHDSPNCKLPYFRVLKPSRQFENAIYIKKENSLPSYLWFVLGIRGSGKSSFLEYLSEIYLLAGGTTIIDIFGSADGENLAWLRSPWGRVLKVLVLHGEDVKVESKRKNIVLKPYTKFVPEDIDKYHIILSSTPLYVSNEKELDAISEIVDKIYERAKTSYVKKGVVVVREAARLLYSRIKYADNQAHAKAMYINMLREARHCGLIMLLDTQKFTSVDLDVRSQLDFLVFKNLGAYTLPRDLEWIYSFIDPDVFTNLDHHEYILFSPTGMLGYGIFPYPKWHKDEIENIFDSIPIVIKS